MNPVKKWYASPFIDRKTILLDRYTLLWFLLHAVCFLSPFSTASPFRCCRCCKRTLPEHDVSAAAADIAAAEDDDDDDNDEDDNDNDRQQGFVADDAGRGLEMHPMSSEADGAHMHTAPGAAALHATRPFASGNAAAAAAGGTSAGVDEADAEAGGEGFHYIRHRGGSINAGEAPAAAATAAASGDAASSASPWVFRQRQHQQQQHPHAQQQQQDESRDFGHGFGGPFPVSSSAASSSSSSAQQRYSSSSSSSRAKTRRALPPPQRSSRFPFAPRSACPCLRR